MRPLVPHVDALRFVEAMELDYEITTIEPLTFILSRMLDQICSRHAIAGIWRRMKSILR